MTEPMSANETPRVSTGRLCELAGSIELLPTYREQAMLVIEATEGRATIASLRAENEKLRKRLETA